MEVRIIGYTDNPLDVIWTAAKVCYSDKSLDDIFEEAKSKGSLGTEETRKEMADFIWNIVKSGHASIMEHASITFAISGISRVTSHQLVRHRVASYSQRSQRYVGDTTTIIPHTILSNGEAMNEVDELVKQAKKVYADLVELGIPKDHARFILPMGSSTQLVASFNYRELMHLFGLRCCSRASDEIRMMAHTMLVCCREVSPEIFNRIGPNCYTTGVCPEGKRSCGKMEEMKKAYGWKMDS